MQFKSYHQYLDTVGLSAPIANVERDGVVGRTVYPQVPPKVEYELTEWGKAMCPALDALLEWAALRPGRSRPVPSGGDVQ